MAIDTFSKYLRRHIRSGSTERINVVIIFPAKTQITYLGNIPIGLFLLGVTEEQNVFSLDVSMNKILIVNMMQSVQNTPNYMNALVELKKSIFSLGLCRVNITLIAIFHDDKYPSLV